MTSPPPSASSSDDDRAARGDVEGAGDDAEPLLGASRARSPRFGGSAGAGAGGSTARRKTIYGHPVGLAVVGATEMWERFGYYAARALLVLYATKILSDATFDVDRVFGLRAIGQMASGYDFSTRAASAGAMAARKVAAEETSARLYGWFACLTYLTPVFGGVISDAILGSHRSALVGATIMAIGYAAMATEWAFVIGLVLVCVGNGAFKPSMSTQLSALYAKDDPRRDQGFSIFYCCINIGAFFSPLIAGTVRVYFGYGAAFASAAIGMACALVIYTTNRRYILDSRVEMIDATTLDVHDEEFGGDTTPLTSPPAANDKNSFAKMLDLMRENVNAMMATLIVCVAGVAFSVVYEQQGSTLMIFADEHINLHGLPTEFVAALNPALVLALTPAVTMVWERQAKTNSEPHQVTKIALGCGLLATSFAVLMFGALPVDSHASPVRVSVIWIVLNQIFLTAGELYTFPVALSYISKIAPEGLLSAIIGLWFGSYFFGNYFSGLLGATYPTFDTPSGFFAMLAALAGAMCVALLLARKPLRRRCPV